MAEARHGFSAPARVGLLAPIGMFGTDAGAFSIWDPRTEAALDDERGVTGVGPDIRLRTRSLRSWGLGSGC
ncbi:MAG: hypothetical protein ACE5E6_06520 [Phycisphaerae bacterium]